MNSFFDEFLAARLGRLGKTGEHFMLNWMGSWQGLQKIRNAATFSQ